jgi:hypothetical protein
MSWFVATIAKQSKHNWDLCKDVGLFGVSTQGRRIGVDGIHPGDRLIVWIGGQGFKALTTISESPRAPLDKSETPWGGGLHRFGIVIPINIDSELDTPLWLGFREGKQEKTGMTQYSLRKSFSLIPDSTGSKILDLFVAAKNSKS